jgi:hypothetical protein
VNGSEMIISVCNGVRARAGVVVKGVETFEIITLRERVEDEILN